MSAYEPLQGIRQWAFNLGGKLLAWCHIHGTTKAQPEERRRLKNDSDWCGVTPVSGGLYKSNNVY